MDGIQAVTKSVDEMVEEGVASKGESVEEQGKNFVESELGNLKYNKISEQTAEDVNSWWKDGMGYSEPPYMPGTIATEIELTEPTTFVRVYDGEKSGMYGGWFMRAEDIEGLTPAEIQNKFALPTLPKYVVDVKLDAGTKIRTGIANPVFGFEGGGIQFDLMGQRTGEFINSRPLP